MSKKKVSEAVDGDDKLLALTGAISAGPGVDDAEMQDASGKEATSTPVAPTKATAAVNLTTLGTGIDQPEAEMAVDFSPLAQLVNSLYSGSYKLFFQALALVEERLGAGLAYAQVSQEVCSIGWDSILTDVVW